MAGNNYEPENYWNERFRIYGHTGWGDKLIYAYDQPMRLKAIDKALARAKLSVSSVTTVLDIGCGTGDLVLEFAKRGAKVTGIDISSEVLEHAKEKFSDFGNVDLLVGRIEDANLASNLFDLVLSVTVLQHITDGAFSKAVANIVRMTKENGYILILETSPINAKSLRPRPYQAIRTRGEWINSFEGKGCRLVYEMGLPHLGIRFLQRYDKAIKLLFTSVRVWQIKELVKDSTNSASDKRVRKLESLYNLTRSAVLKMLKPFDQLLIPFPKNHTTVRILVFEKVAMRLSSQESL